MKTQEQYYKAELDKYNYFRICVDPVCSALHLFKNRPTVTEIKQEFAWCLCGSKTVMINKQQTLKQKTLERIGCTLPVIY
ncbi:MAG: hypothetical protein Rsou_0325 [Candidatus Ruthia sp. Asou_11_S2]|nr:hypothetical protein [Candidatus Ruthia sp. Asou_11_S2]